MDVQSYYQLLRYLKKHLPDIEFSVHRKKLDPDYGACHPPKNNRFQIYIDRNLDEVAAKMVLMHECAHAMSWHTDKHPSDHGPEFGKAYAKIWRLYQQWIEE